MVRRTLKVEQTEWRTTNNPCSTTVRRPSSALTTIHLSYHHYLFASPSADHPTKRPSSQTIRSGPPRNTEHQTIKHSTDLTSWALYIRPATPLFWLLASPCICTAQAPAINYHQSVTGHFAMFQKVSDKFHRKQQSSTSPSKTQQVPNPPSSVLAKANSQAQQAYSSQDHSPMEGIQRSGT